jgi:hypothetical protein
MSLSIRDRPIIESAVVTQPISSVRSNSERAVQNTVVQKEHW